ncbi:MAG: hypothetical protein V3W34_13890 [Phycisphaerae bacterium]
MEVQSLADRRKVAGARRCRPTGMHIIEFPAMSDGSHGPKTGPFPEELRLETTYENGQIASWFDDNWWLETLQRWKDRPLTIHILPTPEALLHTIVLHELEIVRRLQISWKLIGHCYLSDIAYPQMVTRAAVNQYDEIRVMDEDRTPSESYEVRPAKLTIADMFEQVKTIQASEKVSAPLMTRAPAPRS